MDDRIPMVINLVEDIKNHHNNNNTKCHFQFEINVIDVNFFLVTQCSYMVAWMRSGGSISAPVPGGADGSNEVEHAPPL